MATWKGLSKHVALSASLSLSLSIWLTLCLGGKHAFFIQSDEHVED